MDIYQGLGFEDRAEAARRETATLRDSLGIHIWLEPGRISEVESGGNRPVLQEGQTYVFFVAAGLPPTQYAWAYHRSFHKAETRASPPRAVGEGVRLTQEPEVEMAQAYRGGAGRGWLGSGPGGAQ